MGDRVGRKYTFLITLSGMALGTGAIGLIPTFEQIGLAAAFILFGLRMIQGLCLGGQYGGAITYVAEHVSDERRGYYTGCGAWPWLSSSESPAAPVNSQPANCPPSGAHSIAEPKIAKFGLAERKRRKYCHAASGEIAIAAASARTPLPPTSTPFAARRRQQTSRMLQRVA